MPLPDVGAALLDALYQERLLQHYRRPHNRGTLDAPDAAATRTNPLCGESITVAVTLDGDSVGDIRFDGRACSIAQASASMMTEAVRGHTPAQIAALRAQLHQLVTGGPADPALGDLLALSGVARVPARAGCALLAWDALADALAAVHAAG